MPIDNVKEYRLKMQKEFNEYIESVKRFEQEPTKENKKKALEKCKIFSKTKNTLSVKIKDFWCKEYII